MKEISRCTGHCCEKFSLPNSPSELRRAFNRREGEGNAYWKNLQCVVLMVKYLGKLKIDPNGNELQYETHYYTCRNFNKETRNCMNYENRPHMCRNYPYGRKCEYKGCTLKYDEPLIENNIAAKELEWSTGNE